MGSAARFKPGLGYVGCLHPSTHVHASLLTNRKLLAPLPKGVRSDIVRKQMPARRGQIICRCKDMYMRWRQWHPYSFMV